MEMIVALVYWTLFYFLPAGAIITYLIHRHDERQDHKHNLIYVNITGWKGFSK